MILIGTLSLIEPLWAPGLLKVQMLRNLFSFQTKLCGQKEEVKNSGNLYVYGQGLLKGPMLRNLFSFQTKLCGQCSPIA